MPDFKHEGVSYSDMVDAMRQVFNTGRTKRVEWRKEQLKSLIRLCDEQEQALSDALKKDLNKDAYDSYVDEISLCKNEAQWFHDNVSSLMKNRKVTPSVVNLGGTAYVKPEPLGVVLNIGAWNYPVQLVLSPLINILAAGNCCVVKPSEVSGHTAQLLSDLLPKYLDKDCIKVVLGAVPETTELLKVPFDHIMYTGNNHVAKIVSRAAAEHLTPVTLELGGKCPSYVDSEVDLEAVCNRIVWGKFKNAGQTCLAVDYILVHEDVKGSFAKHLCHAIREQYGTDPSKSDDYGRMISNRHYKRVVDLLDSAPDKEILLGGDRYEELNYIGPTVVTGINTDDKIMQEEIFGPILPILTVRSHQEAIDFINRREKALHINVWTSRQSVIDEFVEKTSSGGFSANDIMVFRLERDLPFGGVGSSGTGAYGGETGFLNFSHKKSVLIKPLGFEFLFKMMRYAPHTPTKMKRIRLLSALPAFINKLKFVAVPLLIIVVGLAVFLGLAKGMFAADAGLIPKVEL